MGSEPSADGEGPVDRETARRWIAECRESLRYPHVSRSVEATGGEPPRTAEDEPATEVEATAALESLRMQYDMELGAHRETLHRLLGAKDDLIRSQEVRICELAAQLEGLRLRLALERDDSA